MITPYIPEDSRSTRCQQDMARRYIEATETLLIWCWDKSNGLYVNEAREEAYATIRDVVKAIPDDAAQIFIARRCRAGETDALEDITEAVADAYCDDLGGDPDVSVPYFVRESDAYQDWLDEIGNPSIADENRLCKAQMGLR